VVDKNFIHHNRQSIFSGFGNTAIFAKWPQKPLFSENANLGKIPK
jgi:hypothetical protein